MSFRDPNANAAKALLQKAGGPDKFKGLTYRYNQTGQNDKVAQNLQAQYKANLGVDVQIAPSDFPTLQADGLL